MSASEATTQDAKIEHGECVADVAKEIFSTVCGVELEIRGDEDANQDGVVIALISIVGDIDWSIFMGLPRETAVKVAAQFAGFEIPFDSEDMGDAVGELTNVFGGQVKAALDQRGVSGELSLPTVIRADSMKMLIQRAATGVTTYFDSPLGSLWTGVIMGKDAAGEK